MRSITGRPGVGLVLGAVAAAVLLRFSGIEAKSLWGDEIVNLTVATGHSWYPWQGEEPGVVLGADYYRRLVALDQAYFSERLVALLRTNDQMPPFYYLLLNIWLHLFGTSEAAVRSLSLLASVATIPLIYLLGRALVSHRVGVYSAWIFALAPFQTAFALYNRPYAWLGFFAALSGLAAVHASRARTGTWLIVYAASITLGFYTHYLFVWNVVFHLILIVVYRWHDRRFLNRFALTCLAAAAACAFWIPTFLAQLHWSRELTRQSWFYWYSGRPPLLSVPTSLARNAFLILTGGRFPDLCTPGSAGCRVDDGLRLVVYGAALLMIGLCGRALWRHLTRRTSGSAGYPDPWATCLIWIGCVLVGPALTDILQNSHIVYSHRYFISASAPLYIAAAMGIAGLSGSVARRSAITAVCLFLLTGSVLYFGSPSNSLMYEVAAREVSRHMDETSAGPDDLVLVLDPGPNPIDFAYYLRSNPSFARVKVPERHPSSPDIAAQLSALASAKPRARLWYLDDRGPEKHAHEQVLGWLKTRYTQVETRTFTNMGVLLFASADPAGESSLPRLQGSASGRE